MQKQTTYVGMDVHARTIRVTVLRPNEAQREEWGLANEPRSVASRMLRSLIGKAAGTLAVIHLTNQRSGRMSLPEVHAPEQYRWQHFPGHQVTGGIEPCRHCRTSRAQRLL